MEADMPKRKEVGKSLRCNSCDSRQASGIKGPMPGLYVLKVIPKLE
jgi:hypothetical protein